MLNERERAELESLKKRQNDLLRQLADLTRDLRGLETRLAQSSEPLAAAPPVTKVPETAPAQAAITAAPPLPAPPQAKPVLPPPIPPLIPKTPAFAQTGIKTAPEPINIPSEKHPSPIETRREAERSPVSNQIAAAAPSAEGQPSPPPKRASFEMRLGTYWLVRIGIVMVLTALAFFGNYAYQNFIGRIGPAGKVILLYLASGGLLGVGAWLYRRHKTLRNYSQVLIAGGLAAVYFTTYAAHHLPSLQVIASPLVDGALLLGWAGFIIWLADRTKSEVLALFAVLLAYYTGIVTHVGSFTLYSNLVLTLAAVFFLVRNRWATLSFASLAATYVSYGFWRFYQDGHWQWATPGEGLWTGNYFLMGYWVLFTAAVFLSRHEQFSGSRRATFLSVNNGAFFTAFILTMLQVHQGGFWKFSLAYGAVLLGLAASARKFLVADKLSHNTYLTQGLLLVTLGFLTYFTGFKLSLVLAVESVVLIALGRMLNSRVMQAGSLAAAALAAGWAAASIEPFDNTGLMTGAAVGAMMLLNAFLLRREITFEQSASHPRTIFYTALAALMGLVTTWQNATPPWRGFALAVESTAFLIAARPLGNQVMKFGAYFFAAVAVVWETITMGEQLTSADVHSRVGLTAATSLGALMIFNALWERRAFPPKSGQTFHPPVTFFSLLGLATWLLATCVFTPHEFLAPLLAFEGFLFTAAYYPLRLAELPLLGQFFLLFAQSFWLFDDIGGQAARPWWNAASIIAVTLGLAQWWQRQKTLQLKEPVGRYLQGIYALAIVGLLYFWLEPRFDAPAWLAFTSLLAILLTAYAAFSRFWFIAATGQVFLAVSIWQFGRQFLEGKPEWYLPLAPIVALGLLSFSAIQWFKRKPEAKAELREPLLQIGQVYRVIALVMSVWWIVKYIPPREQFWVFALAGLALFLIAGWRRNRELLIFSAVFTLTGFVRWSLPRVVTDADPVCWLNLAAILLLLAQQRFAKRLPERYPVPAEIHAGAIVLGGLGLWLYFSRWILQSSDGFYLTAGWSGLALALFVTGMALRERIYRWLGLGVLACALGRIVIFDVWKLETIYRILSFLALGIVLLVLGFIYNKYQEKIREWL
jgi:uncharacterized membrane protein